MKLTKFSMNLTTFPIISAERSIKLTFQRIEIEAMIQKKKKITEMIEHSVKIIERTAKIIRKMFRFIERIFFFIEKTVLFLLNISSNLLKWFGWFIEHFVIFIGRFLMNLWRGSNKMLIKRFVVYWSMNWKGAFFLSFIPKYIFALKLMNASVDVSMLLWNRWKPTENGFFN